MISRRPVEDAKRDAFVGSAACTACHADIARKYAAHPMARSISAVSQAAVIEDYSEVVSFAPPGPRRYRVERLGDRVWHHEEMRATVSANASSDGAAEIIYDQGVEIGYALGSGTRGRSYLIDHDGQFFASSINWYTAASRWDLAPGYPPANHLRFERMIPEECLFCHSGRTSPAQPAVGRYADPPFHETTIGCERCHGPGRRHVDQQRAGAAPNNLEAAIVNPANLDPDRRDSVCNQCHLHGEYRGLRFGKALADFRSGQRLDDVLCVLVRPAPPQEQGALRAVSQVEQVRASACFRQSAGALGCISCHDPHELPQVTDREDYYRQKCLACHADHGCSLAVEERQNPPANDSCIHCHMPRTAAGGIPHTAQTDHRILRRSSAQDLPDQHDLGTLVFFGDSSAVVPAWEQARARGMMLLDLSQWREDRVRLAAQAEKLLREALAQAPDDLAALQSLGTSLLRQSRQRDALECWDRILEREPDRGETLHTQAVLCQAIGEFDKAGRSFERLIRLSPWHAELHSRYAQLLARTGDWAGVVAAARRAIEIDPTQTESRELLAVGLARLNRQAESRQQVEILGKIRAAAETFD